MKNLTQNQNVSTVGVALQGNPKPQRHDPKNQKAITLIALVITIIVLLILAGVTIGMITGDSGILKTAKEAEVETRGASVEEQRDIWLAERYLQKTVGTQQKTMEEILDELSANGLLTAEEVEIIKNDENNEITIGSKTISFKVDDSSSSGGGTPEEDKEPPTVTISTENITAFTATLIVTANDSQSGLAETGTYKYYLNEALITTLETNNYTYTGLSLNTDYTLGVIVTDKAGNTSELITTTITTSPPIASKLKEGDYVNYVDKNGTTRKCVVLYGPENANYSSYGIQIITSGTLGTVTLGSTTFSTAQTSYNNAISTLNSKAAEYLNTTYASSARSVGSVPDKPSSEATTYFSSSYSYMSSYNGKFKNSDSNFNIDWTQMGTLSIRTVGAYYWLATRYVSSYSNYSYFIVRSVNSSGYLDNYYLCVVDSDDRAYSTSYEYALRPVFTLKSEIKVTGGSGTSDDPWILGT